MGIDPLTYRHFQESRDLSPATTKENLWKGLKYRGRIRHSSWRKSKRFTFSRVMPPIDTRHFRVNRGRESRAMYSASSLRNLNKLTRTLIELDRRIARSQLEATKIRRRRAPSSMFLSCRYALINKLTFRF